MALLRSLLSLCNDDEQRKEANNLAATFAQVREAVAELELELTLLAQLGTTAEEIVEKDKDNSNAQNSSAEAGSTLGNAP